MRRLIYTTWVVLIAFILIGCQETDEIDTIVETPNTSEPTNEMPHVNHDLFHNSFGFSSLIITKRDDLSTGYYEVTDEIEFLDALLQDDVKVIHIQSDLSLGSLHVQSLLEERGRELSDYRAVFRPHSRQPLLHPVLKESGVGLVRIILKEHLTIFSTEGHKIKHASFLIDGSKDILIRNLHFTELWEWDELDQGQYKRNDWDYFTVEKSSGIWFDHLTFDQVYDGIIDVKERGEHITLSWSKLNFRPNAFIEAQILYLEEHIEDHPYYQSLRDAGVSVEDIITYASFQKKGFNLGNTTDGEGFETITFTFHHLEVFNLMDRMPRLRKGDVHLYHVILDNTELHDLRLKHNQRMNFVNQGLVPTEDGAILMENSIFKYVSNPIRNHQDSNPDVKYTGKYFVSDSELITPTRTYFGSSETPLTLWTHSNIHDKIAFSFRNYENIPYHYTLNDVFYLSDTFQIYPTGHQFIEGFDWLYIDTDLHIKGA